MPPEQFQSCIDACNDCAAACDHCAMSCLKEQATSRSGQRPGASAH